MYSQLRKLITTSFLLLYKSILKKFYGSSKNSKSNVNYNKKNNVIAVVSTEQNSVVKYTDDIMDLASPELIALLFQFALGLSSGVITNTLLKSYCLQIPNITENNCSGIIPKEIENEVQPNVSQMILIKAVIETLMPGMAILFVGPWSDSHGRRPLLLLSMAGFTISYSMWAVLAYKMYMNPLYFLLPSIPVCLSGGLTTFFLSVVCSISDITPVNKRAFKMAVFEAACMAGIFTSQLLTARVSEGPNGFTITFSISAVICFITFLYVYFLFPETVLYTQEIDHHHQGFVLDVFKTCFKSRPDYGRAVLFLTICVNTAYILIIFGEGSVFYLNTQKRFSWDLLDYSEFTSFGVVISGFTLYFGTWFLTSVLHLKDMTALLLVAIPRMFSSLIYGFSSNWKFLYLGVCIGCITTLITPLYRSQISKLVPLHELGKVMSFVMFVEAIVPTGATTLYTMIYNATITFFPGAIFLVSFTLSVICTTCISLCKLIQYYHPSQDFSQLPVVVDIAHSPGDEDKLVDQN